MASEEAEIVAILSDRVLIRSSMLWKSDFIYRENTKVYRQYTESIQRIHRVYTRMYREHSTSQCFMWLILTFIYKQPYIVVAYSYRPHNINNTVTQL